MVMQCCYNVGNDNCVDNVGIEGFNFGYYCQIVICYCVLSEIDVEVIFSGYFYCINEIVSGQEIYYYCQISMFLCLFSKVNG